MESFANYRERKEFYYGQKIKGLSAFLYVWMPLISVFAGWGFISKILSYSGNILELITAAVYVLFAILTLAFSRGLDASTFFCSVAFLIYLVVQWGVSIIGMLLSTSSLSESITSGSMMNDVISAGFQLGMGIVLFAEIIDLLIISIFVAYYLHMFIRHKRFFTKSLAELRKDFEKKYESLKD